jgi:hypothetical protein
LRCFFSQGGFCACLLLGAGLLAVLIGLLLCIPWCFGYQSQSLAHHPCSHQTNHITTPLFPICSLETPPRCQQRRCACVAWPWLCCAPPPPLRPPLLSWWRPCTRP